MRLSEFFRKVSEEVEGETDPEIEVVGWYQDGDERTPSYVCSDIDIVEFIQSDNRLVIHMNAGGVL